MASGSLPHLLLLLEHPHIYTLGKRGSLSDILASPKELTRLGIEVHHSDRGGEVTYHGPGQLVGYAIVNLRHWGGGALKYVRALEEALISTLSDFSISGTREGKGAGVWIGNAKIAAIGVKVNRAVTMHGFALNVNPDLSYFDLIVPCGVPNGSVTSMASEMSDPIEVSQVIPSLTRHFGEVFGYTMEQHNHVEWIDHPPFLRGLIL